MSFTPVSVKTGQLYAELVPKEDGETEFADMRAGYDALDEATKARIETMVSYHSLDYQAFRRTGMRRQPVPDLLGVPTKEFPEGTPGELPGMPVPSHDLCYLRPLVKTHPETGRKCLLAPASAFGIPDLSRAESTQLLDDLCNNTCQPPRTYKHKYRPGDMVIWDETSVFHRSRPYDPQELRKLWGFRTRGTIESEGALPGPDPKLPGAGVRAPNAKAILAAELDALAAEKPWETRDWTQENPRGGW